MLCLNCEIPILNKRKYCSNKCQKEYQYKKYIENWKSGLENGMRGNYQISMHIKTYLFKKFNNKCARCGWREVNPYTKNISTRDRAYRWKL